MTTTSRQAALPVADRLWPAAAGAAGVARLVALAIFGTCLLWASAKVQVPFWPVPMTLQTGVVLALGVAYGWRLAAATVVLYLAQGAVGLPVFAGTPERGLGLAYMLGPTGGYLLGFVAGATIAGLATERARGVIGLGLGLVLAMAAIYACGVLWLAGFVGPGRVLAVGVVPFLLGDALKTALVLVLALVAMRTARPGA